MPEHQQSDSVALKHMFSAEFVANVATEIKRLYPRFKSNEFVSFTLEPWPVLELKARQIHIARALKQFLPQEYAQAVAIITQIAPKFKGYVGVTFPQFVSDFGLEHYKKSVSALEILTQYSSSEFAVRPFILAYPSMMTKQMLAWSKHKNEHVRRLSSEGMRPRLPWAAPFKHFQEDPSPIIPILENLKDDPSEYVRRSVANTLNDISKDHPDLVLELAELWIAGSETRKKLVQHACRTLIKQGSQRALLLFGQPATKDVVIVDFTASCEKVRIGDSCKISIVLENTSSNKTHNVRCSYAIHFVKSNGTTSHKVFSWKQLELSAKQKAEFHRKVRFQHFSTRTLFPGVHSIVPIINGTNGKEILITVE